MSIYVKVGDEVFMIAGPSGPECGRTASSPIPADVVELEIAEARARVPPRPTVDQEQFSPMAKWCRWAGALLGDDRFQDDAVRRRKIGATVAPPKPGRDLNAELDAGYRGDPSTAGRAEGVVACDMAMDRGVPVAARLLESGHEVAERLPAAPAAGTVTLTQVAGTFVERRPPKRVDAVLWTGSNWPDVEAWLEGRVESAKLDLDNPSRVIVWIDDDRMRCDVGDWFVQDGSGEVRTLTPERFEKLYEPAASATLASGSEEVTCARVTGEVFAPTMLRATLSAPTLDELKALFCSYASKIGLVTHDVGIPTFEDLKAGHLPVADEVGAARFGRELRALRSSVDALAAAVGPSPRPRPETPRVDDLVVEACARVANDVYAVGHEGMPSWEHAQQAQKEVARASARAVLDGVTPEQWHARWLAEKTAEGWVLGDVKDEGRKTHPNLRPYRELPAEQRMLDDAFDAAVRATLQAIDELEAACGVPVLKVRGDVSPEQFADFRREWARQVQSGAAWKTPIVDAPDVITHRPTNPYTRSGMVAFVDDQIDAMLRTPELWGSLRDVEQQVLLLLEVRGFVSAGHGGTQAVMETYTSFVRGVLTGRQLDASAAPLADQLEAAGRADEFIGAMKVFVEARRSAPGAPAPKADGQ